MNSKDKIKNVSRFMRGKFNTEYGQKCLKKANPIALALAKATKKAEHKQASAS